MRKSRHENGMDQPIWRRYIRWLGNAVHGDFGVSYQSGQSALKEVLKCFPVTLKLAAAAFLILIILGIPLGILSAVWENSVLDKILQIFSFFSGLCPRFLDRTAAAVSAGGETACGIRAGSRAGGFPSSGADVGYWIFWRADPSDEKQLKQRAEKGIYKNLPGKRLIACADYNEAWG